ncbi:hypothetical protein [Stenotrophomonas sp. YIM B06876]|uniref:hypothetical protein n=1 Tax=Stenotrophomonas sp. YIM B06876 TaxID=3060211 RepID=UPI00273A4F3E|nr:hypothetical protein [Stenotrophomonas sp. YIM B06876]
MLSVDTAAECPVPVNPPSGRNHGCVPTATVSPPSPGRHNSLTALPRLEAIARNELKALQTRSISATGADDWLGATIAWDLGLALLPPAARND